MATGEENVTSENMSEVVRFLRKEIEDLRKENGVLVKRVEELSETGDRDSVLMGDEETQNRSDLYYKMGLAEIKEMIDPFNPDGDNKINAVEWIRNIEALKQIHSWDDRTTLYYASLRLEGAAKYWKQSRQADLKKWNIFKVELVKSFPSDQDDSAVIMKIMSRKRKREEGVETYFYEITALAKRIALSEQATMEYIISGLGDGDLINSLTGADFNSLTDLLERIKRYEKINVQKQCREALITCQENINRPSTSSLNHRYQPYHRSEHGLKRRSTDENKQRNAGNVEKRQNRHEVSKDKAVIRCYKCDGIGHYARVCTSNHKKRFCYICKKEDHLAKSCPKAIKHVGQIELKENSKGKEYYPKVEVGRQELLAFLDLGSDVTTITENVVKENNWRMANHGSILYGFGGSATTVLGKTEQNMKIGEVEGLTTFLVVPNSAQTTPIIVGKDFLDRVGVKIIKRPGKFEVLKDNECVTSDCAGINKNQELDNAPTVFQIRKGISADQVKIHSEVNDLERSVLLNIINDFGECFSHNPKEIGKTNLVEMHIKLKENKVIKYQPYKVPYGLKTTLKNTVEELLDLGIIRHSTSEFASPVILIPKKNGDYRMCVDYRKLNSITQREQYPVPNIEETLNTLANKKIYTSLDFRSGYYQIPIEEKNRHYTAFITPEGHYEFNRMPFGLTNSPATFMRLMTKLIEPITRGSIIVYMDDILIPSETVKENIEILRKLLNEVRKAGLKLNLEKCKFLQTTLEFLGHEITSEGIKPGLMKTAAVEKFPKPTTVKEVRQFLGLAGYFRRFVNGFANIARPLNKLLRKNEQFKWGEEEESAFQQLKSMLINRPVLTPYDPDAEHEVHTDASSHGLAGVLMQNGIKDQKLRAVSYFSRATTEAESKYHSYELEALAVVESLERFKHYLLLTKFKIVTDCNSLRMTQEKRNLIPRIARWWLKIQEYEFELIFRPGKQLSHVDALSRTPHEEGKEGDTVAERVMIVSTSPEEWVVTLQMQDPRLQEIRRVLEGDLLHHEDKDGIKGNYIMQHGRVYKKTDGGNKFVVPTGIRWRIIKSMHDDRGHCGLNRTMENIRKTFWFPNMKQVVTKYVNSCIDCLYNQRGADESRYILHSQEVLPIPFHTVHLDHLGPFPKSRGGNQHVIGMADSFTKFVVFKPTRTTGTKSVTKMLDEVSQYFGLPSRIITDRGSAFTSKEFERYCHDNAIKHTLIAVKTPRANGQIERYFRTLKSSLSTMTKDEGGRDWDKHITEIQIALNSTKHSTTKRTPQEILMGYTPRNMVDNKLTLILHDQMEEELSLSSKLDEIRQEAKQRIDENKIKQADRHNQKCTPPRQYTKGDLVLIKQEPIVTGQPKKLQPRYRGPYEIKAVLGNDRYIVTDTSVTQMTQKRYESVHSAENLRPWCSLTDIAFDEEDEEDEREV